MEQFHLQQHPHDAATSVKLRVFAFVAQSGYAEDTYFVSSTCCDLRCEHALWRCFVNTRVRGTVPGAPLLAACKAGDTRRAAFLLSCGARVDVCDNSGNTALHYACSSPFPMPSSDCAGREQGPGHRLPLLRLLLDNGASVHAGDEIGRSALLRAYDSDPSSPAVGLLLQYGSDLLAVDLSGIGLLPRACAAGDLPMLQRCAGAGASLNYSSLQMVHQTNRFASPALEGGGNPSWTLNFALPPLTLTAQAGESHHELSRWLIDNGADVNGTYTTGVPTPLHMAARSGNLPLTLLLLQAGAVTDVGDGSYPSRTPLQLASTDAVAQALLSHGASHGKVSIPSPEGWRYNVFSFKQACSCGNIAAVQSMLAQGADPNGVSTAGSFPEATPLICAAQGGHASIVRLLLAAGADPLFLYPYEPRNALVAAIEGKHEEAALALLDDPRVVQSGMAEAVDDVERTTPLFLACGAGLERVVTRLFDISSAPRQANGSADDTVAETSALWGPILGVTGSIADAIGGIARFLGLNRSFLHVQDQYRCTLLHQLAKSGVCLHLMEHPEVLRSLHSKAYHGRTTPLSVAVENACLPSVEKLLSLGARHHDDGGRDFWAAKFLATQDIHAILRGLPLLEQATLLSKRELLKQLLHDAVSMGRTGAVRALLAAGAPVRGEDHTPSRAHGNPPPLPLLICASGIQCPKAAIEVSTLLLEAGVEVDGRGEDGKTALHAACERRRGQQDLPLLLLQAGCDAVAQAAGRTQPLHLACQAGHVDVVARLLQAGSDPGAVLTNGTTPLHFACSRGHTAIARLLLARGADHLRQDMHGFTPLQYACRAQMEHCVLSLLRSHPSMAASLGPSPITFAAQHGLAAVVSTLLDRGIEALPPTALHTAAEGYHLGAVRVLLARGAAAHAARPQDGLTAYQLADQRIRDQLPRLDAHEADSRTARVAYHWHTGIHHADMLDLLRAWGGGGAEAPPVRAEDLPSGQPVDWRGRSEALEEHFAALASTRMQAGDATGLYLLSPAAVAIRRACLDFAMHLPHVQAGDQRTIEDLMDAEEFPGDVSWPHALLPYYDYDDPNYR